MPYTKSREDPRPPRSARGIGSQRNASTPSRDASSRAPRQRSPRCDAARPRSGTGNEARRAIARFAAASPGAVGGLGPEGLSSPWPGQRLLLAMRHHGCVRSTPAIHISKMSTSAPSGYDDRSPWVTQFTLRGSLRPARAPPRSTVRRPGQGTGRSSDASVATRGRRITPGFRVTKTAFAATP